MAIEHNNIFNLHSNDLFDFIDSYIDCASMSNEWMCNDSLFHRPPSIYVLNYRENWKRLKRPIFLSYYCTYTKVTRFISNKLFWKGDWDDNKDFSFVQLTLLLYLDMHLLLYIAVFVYTYEYHIQSFLYILYFRQIRPTLYVPSSSYFLDLHHLHLQ